MYPSNLESLISQGKLKLIEVSKLSVDDKILSFEPETKQENNLKERLVSAIKMGQKDFYKPYCDPAFTDDEEILYDLKKKPATGKPFEWWKEQADRLGGRIMSKSEYIAFLGVLIKSLVESGLKVNDAWNLIANDVKELFDSSGVKKTAINVIEDTGSRGDVCGFYDLSNTYKILKEDESYGTGGFLIASGKFFGIERNYPVAELGKCYEVNYKFQDAIGAIVFDP